MIVKSPTPWARRGAVLALATLLGACGQTGKLYLPKKPPAAPGAPAAPTLPAPPLPPLDTQDQYLIPAPSVPPLP